MASLYYATEDGLGALELEGSVDNYLLEPITNTLVRHIRRTLPIAATAALDQGILLQLDGIDGYVLQENTVSPAYVEVENASGVVRLPQPGAGSLVLQGYAPVINQTGVPKPGAGTLTLTGYAPTLVEA